MEQEYTLMMKNIGKEFSGNPVLKGIDLCVKPGEIHALLGENGAGKSTLMNILFGMPVIHSTGGFTGEILLNGERVDISSPKHAMDLGIGMVHQEFMLIPGFTVTENLKLNREATKPNKISNVLGDGYALLDKPAMREDAEIALRTVGMPLDPDELIESLPVGHMQFLEIAREIDKSGIKLLVFDEPTAVLNESEAQNLIKSMKRLADSGIAVIFITHRLQEVIDVCDTVTILRDGTLISTCPVSETSANELAKKMVGRKVGYSDILGDENRVDKDNIIMSIRGLKVQMPGENVRGVDIDVRRGEILGIGGLAGHGKLGIPNGIMGLCTAKGEVTYNGDKLPLNDTLAVLKRKISFLSEDRKRVGLQLGASIEDNMVYTAMQVNGEYLHNFKLFTISNGKKISEFANRMIDDFDIRCTGTSQRAGDLSGGNQQKVCLAKALAMNPELLFVSEPTRGIDIGAKKLVLDKLRDLSTDKGVTVVVVSSELSELRSICDRIIIVNSGKVSAILSPHDDDVRFGLAMAGENLDMEAMN